VCDDCLLSERSRIPVALLVIVGSGVFMLWRAWESWGPTEDGMPTTRAQPLWLVWLGIVGLAAGVALLVTTGRKKSEDGRTDQQR
jgi:LPXTG-motif cell wall-anchored protein